MTVDLAPRLFGLHHSNRDFSQASNWGKNQFNSSFPASLACYMEAAGRSAMYLQLHDGEFRHAEAEFTALFGISLLDDECFFAFEAAYSPYQRYLEGVLPRTDLVLQNLTTGAPYVALEIKLTALPDHVTSSLGETHYGSELVVRPDTIVYLACSLARNLGERLAPLFADWQLEEIEGWQDAERVLPHWPRIAQTLADVMAHSEAQQTAFLLQPIWKTEGKSPKLAEQCLDIFVWSDSAFLYFMLELAGKATPRRINRYGRSTVWLFLMLLHISKRGHVHHQRIIDVYSFNTKNDKAFAANGRQTSKFMLSPRLVRPAVSKHEIKQIILGGGQHLLSPERRFDAVLVNDPTLFKTAEDVREESVQ